MKTSIIEHILEPSKQRQLRALLCSSIGSRACISGLLILALSWSLVLPFNVRAKRLAISPPPAAPASSAPLLTHTSETFTVYGPHRFTRNPGQPVNVVENFSLPADAASPFTILVENGAPSGSNRVSSATIKLNGTSLYSPNDFNQNVASLTKPVTLAATNILEVNLASAPGSYLTITFTATRVASQATLDSVTPARTTQGQTLNVTLRGTNTHWVAGQTRASLGGEVAIGGAGYGELGPVTVVNATTLIAAVVVSPTGALEPRTARVVTTPLGGGADELLSLPESFTVDAAIPPGASAANVSTIAGGAGVAGFADGNGAQARFRTINGVAVGPDDAIYLADSGNHRIRVVRSQTGGSGTTWTVSTLAGNGTAGFADGPGAAAQFNNPQGVAIDASGVVYVADTANNRVRRIASDGTVSTLAGDGTAGLQNGAGSQARFNAPQGVATDSQGNVYVADTGNAAVRMVNSGGTVSTLAGDGTVGSNDSPGARFDGLVGVAVEGQNVYAYLSDTGNHRIRRLDVAGTVITVTGAERGFKDGSASQARFAEPSGIAIDGAGKIVIADGVNSLIRLVDPDLATNGSNQAVVTLAGTGVRGLTDGTGDVARFFTPRGLAVSNSSAIIVADTGNQVLRRILLPPIIHAINPPSARTGDTITINGARFDGRGPERNVVRFTRSQQAGGGQTFGSVTQATRTALTVVVPTDAATGPVTVATEGGTATSPSDFVVQNFPAPVITDFNPKRGPVGTQVTITGTNLKVDANDPAVTFAGSNGRLPALVSSASATQVVATVPNAAITGTIELTHVGGTAATATPFTVDTEQDFQLTVAPSAVTAVQGSAATYIIYLTSQQTTFSQLASLTVTGLPNGITASFNPSQITAGATSTLTLNVSGTIAPSSYPFTIHGVASVGGQKLEHTAGATLNVMAGGQTTLSGRVLSTDKEPIIGATASLDGHTAMTDAAGAFLLSGVTAGTNRPLMVDGRTASSPNRTYPVIIEPANIVAGQANVVPYTFFLPPIDTQYEVEVVPGQATVASNPGVPGLQMTIPAGANLRNRDGSPVARVSITPLAIDRTPAPLPAGIKTGLVYTSQPGGALTDIPLPVVYPNMLGVDPGTRVELYAFNHDTVQWYVYGYGRVSTDGRTIAPETDPSTGRPYGLRDFSWHFPNAGPNGDGGGGGGGCDSCPCSRGDDPVDHSTGIKFENVTDVSWGGARGGITLTRLYSSDNSAQAILGRFGRGWKDGYDIRLTGNWSAGGAGRVVMPDEQTGRLFNYARSEGDGTLVFTTTATVGQLGDVVRKLTDGTFDYRRDGGDVTRFDSSGRPISMVDRNGNTTTLTYTGLNLTQITDPVGRTLTLGYDSNNRVISVTDHVGRAWHYTYDPSVAFGILGTVTDPLGEVTTYGYTNLRLSSITDPRGNLVKRIIYDSSGRVISQQFADGGIERYDYTLSGGIITETTITDPLSRKTTKRFNASGYVIGTTDALGQSSKIERAIGTNLATSTTGPCGCLQTSSTFDSRGNTLTNTDSLGHTESFEYEPVFNKLTKYVDKLGKVTTYAFDSNGNLTSITQAVGTLNLTSSFTHNSFGELTAATDPLGHTTQFQYDALGNMTSRIDPLSNSDISQYDQIGRLTSFSDPLGRTTTMTYNALYLTGVTDSAGATKHFDHDANGNQTRVTDSLQHQWTYGYDAKNNNTSITDPLGNRASFFYNLDNEMFKAFSPSGRTTLYDYDANGHTLRITDSRGGAVNFAYDNWGNLLTLSDQRGNTTSYRYDELFRPIAEINANGDRTTVTYDAMDNVVDVIDRLGRHIRTTYDDIYRPIATSYADATVTRLFDAASKLTELHDTAGGDIRWTYDEADRTLTETTPTGVVSYAYNSANQRTSMTTADRSPLSYDYDAAGRLRTIMQGSEVFTYGYDTLSRRSSLQRPNGVTTNYSYDAAYRLIRLTHANAQNQPIEDLQYTYNADNEISSITSLASATLLPQAANVGTADAANRITQFGSATFTFDAQGQTTSRSDSSGTTAFQWDARGRLTQVTKPGNPTVSYSYDALGRRSARSALGVTDSYLYDGSDIALDKGSDGSAVDYINGPNIDEKLRQSSTAGLMYLLQDHLGSTIATTDAGGNVAERFAYEPYGGTAAGQLTRFKFTGREADAVTKLIYFRARYYDPDVGRFISEDPLAFKAGFNFYEYVGDEPIQGTDPTGLKCKTCGLKQGPEYSVTGTVAAGTQFTWHAEFLNDKTHDPACCEVRQLTSWTGGGKPNHAGFAGSGFKSGHWYEDRDGNGKRYGRRKGPYSDLHPGLDWYQGNVYDGMDQPNIHHHVLMGFRLIAVDVCQGGKVIYTSKTIHVQF
jgi:RHS repeat-associated protein